MTYRMGKAIGTSMRVCIPRIGMGRVCMPIIGNREAGRQAGDDVLRDLKSHIIGWYDVKRQGCTNDSLAENPVLEDLSGNNHPLELHNFTFGGLSGMGGYGTDLTKWTVTASGAIINRTAHKATVNVSSAYTPGFRLEYKDAPVYFKAKVDVPGVFEVRSLVAATATVSADENGVFEIYSDYFSWIYFVPAERTTLQYTIEILPNFPDSLVFNGVTPTRVYDKSNIVVGKDSTWITHNKLAVKESTCSFECVYHGVTGKDLQIKVPSFKIRVSGLKDNERISINKWYKINDIDTYLNLIVITDNGTFIVPSQNVTVNSTELNPTPIYRVYGITRCENATIDFLHNYEASKTGMYGDIPNIPLNTVKCMMMDFVPFADKVDSWYYCQRKEDIYNRFAIVNCGSLKTESQDTSKIIAYSARNALGTYINGTINTNKTVLSILQQRQVVSVNDTNPKYEGIFIGNKYSIDGSYVPQMAFNSLILFDRELTEKEMKLVMNKLMKYKDTDNIAADFQRAREMTLAEADEPEETGGLEEFWEME
ncbi:MAG: hypothetical protein K2G12_06775 [Prevotella sp.]|nr:hypothetical protein [Prevotella sp.]